jgi:hypothetical protein
MLRLMFAGRNGQADEQLWTERIRRFLVRRDGTPHQGQLVGLAWIHQRTTWPTKAALRTALFDYIEGFYNPGRIQQRLHNRSPIGFEPTLSRDNCVRQAGSRPLQAARS